MDTETKLKQEAANVKTRLNTEVQSLTFSGKLNNFKIIAEFF